MVNMKCELCGMVWLKDDSFKGMEFRCPECLGICKIMSEEVREQPDYECLECGLPCLSEASKCPACGGRIVASTGAANKGMSDDSRHSSEQNRCSFWDDFGWGIVFPGSLLIIGLFALFNCGIKARRRMSVGFICGAMVSLCAVLCISVVLVKYYGAR